MDISQILVTTIGIGLLPVIAWFFWFSKKKGTVAEIVGSVQEAFITVKGGYNPDVIVVEVGKPVRLNFNRQETAACTEMVVFPDFNKSANLPTGENVSIEILPEQPGEYDFSCQMGMIHGKIIAEAP